MPSLDGGSSLAKCSGQLVVSFRAGGELSQYERSGFLAAQHVDPLVVCEAKLELHPLLGVQGVDVELFETLEIFVAVDGELSALRHVFARGYPN